VRGGVPYELGQALALVGIEAFARGQRSRSARTREAFRLARRRSRA
jgi:hypothetical protein